MKKLERERERERRAYATVNLDKLDCSSEEDGIAMKSGNEKNRVHDVIDLDLE